MDLASSSRESTLHLVTFHVADMKLAVDIHAVEEVIQPSPLTRLPQAPVFLAGMINLRGRIIPVLDLRSRFQAPPAADAARNRIIIVGMEQGRVGFLVDGVGPLVKVARAKVERPSRSISGLNADYLAGVVDVGGQLVIILDLQRVLTREEKTQIAGAVGGGAASGRREDG